MSLINRQIKENFFIRLYFGVVTDFYLAGVKRAYLDFSRTLHLGNETKLQRERTRKLMDSFLTKQLKILIKQDLSNQNEFDILHKILTLELKNKWNKLSIGQAQKWVNMSLKYWLLFGEQRIPYIEKNAKYFHIPIDSVIQKSMFSDIKHSAWSKINDYESGYMKYQNEYRNQSNEIPILAEFKLFNESK